MTFLENQTDFHQQQKHEIVAHHHRLYSDQRRPRQQPKNVEKYFGKIGHQLPQQAGLQSGNIDVTKSANTF